MDAIESLGPAEPHTMAESLTLPDIQALSSLPKAQELYLKHIPMEKALQSDFWDKYTQKEQLYGLKACLAMYVVTGLQKTPRVFQLEATIALCSGKDVLVHVGTGYGKTFCMILPVLLFPNNITIIISPLKKLQETQFIEFSSYGISTLIINEETSNDSKLWKDVFAGEYAVLIVQAEQLSNHSGHFPRLLQHLHKRDFTKRIKFLFVDETHNIFTAGIDLYGTNAFRPAWGCLSELRTRLGSKVTVAGLSGTLPKHIKDTVKHHLQFDDDRLCSIQLSCNRPNIAYATHEIVGEFSDYHNLDFIIQGLSASTISGPQRRKGIVFHDNIEGARAAKMFQDEQLPPNLQGKGLIKTFYSLMSAEYLEQTYNDFKDPNGQCLILHATEAASTGLDVQGIHWVVQYGVPREMTMTLQRAGRCGRDGVTPSIFLLMYEPWVKDLDLSAAAEEEEAAKQAHKPLDPDRPFCGTISENPKSTKQDRTAISMLKFIQNSGTCMRETFARYNEDVSSDALSFTGYYCCSSSTHSTTLDTGRYFPGKLLYRDSLTNITYYGSPSDPNRQVLHAPAGEKRPSPSNGPHNRLPVVQRSSLASQLAKWRYETWEKEKYRAILPPYLILCDKSLEAITKIHPSELLNLQQVTLCVGESSIWEGRYSEPILNVIRAFDAQVGQLQEEDRLLREEQKKRRKLEKIAEDKENDRRAFEADRTKRLKDNQVVLPAASRTVLEEAHRRLQELNSQDTSFRMPPANEIRQRQVANTFELDDEERRRDAEARARVAAARILAEMGRNKVAK